MEGIGVVCDGVWQGVSVVLIFYVFSTLHYLRLWGSKAELVVELVGEYSYPREIDSISFLVRSPYRCRVMVCRVCVVGLAGINNVWFGYP